MSALTWFYLVFALALFNWGVTMASLKSFLSRTSAIRSTVELQDFAGLARRHMYQALLQVTLLVAGMILGILALFKDQAGLLLILVLNGLIWGAGTLGKPLEERARSLQTGDPYLAKRYQAICTSWVKRPFPDF